jgi:hypothetical protein
MSDGGLQDIRAPLGTSVMSTASTNRPARRDKQPDLLA